MSSPSPLSNTLSTAMNVTPRRPMPDRNIMEDISDINTASDPPSSPFMANIDAENLPPNDIIFDNDETMCSTFSAVPTPKRASNETTNLIVDFTEQFNSISHNYRTSPTKRDRAFLSPSKTQPDFTTHTQSQRTPSPKKAGRMSNLLDFDIPPAPTPRSMPSITPRELESLRSGFLCEISNLKAELSGKEAETSALKKAVADAEKRTGENMEKLREEQQMREQLAAEKELLEKRGNEMEQVLRNVKEEIVLGERERDDLEGRLEECEKRREAAEMMHQEAESRIAAMRAGKPVTPDEGEKNIDPEATNKEVELAVEKVARELHTLYKSKHETKVAALKKSYEGRWQRRVKELEDKLEQVTKDFEDLRTAHDATMSGVVPTVPNPAAAKDMPDFQEELKAQSAKDAATAKELEAKLLGLTEEVKCINRENASLRQELENERVEKGELVAAVEEMFELQMQTANAAINDPVATASVVENLKGSVSRASGLRMPSAGESRIGKFGGGGANGSGSGGFGYGHERNRNGGSQSRTGSAQGSRSGIMSSIEKMGGKGQ